MDVRNKIRGCMLGGAAAFARRYELLESGGSDFHGANKPDICLGTGKGNLYVPNDFYFKLKDKYIRK